MKRTSCVNLWVSLAILAMLVIAPPLRAETDTANWLHTGRHVFQSTWNNFIGSWQINGSNVLATATELNKLAGSASTNGTAKGGNTATESVIGEQHKTVITLSTVLALADGGFQVSSNIYTFPEGVILIEGATLDATGTMGADGLNNHTADLYYMGVGSAVADKGDGRLETDEVDVIPETVIDSIDGTNLVSAIHGYGPVPARFDGTATAVALQLSMGIPAANDNKANTNTITGTLTIFWKNMGDY